MSGNNYGSFLNNVFFYVFNSNNKYNTYMLTIKGCLTSFRIVISLRKCSTCFNLITSTIERIFKARGVPWCLQRTTLPNVPVPGNCIGTFRLILFEICMQTYLYL